MATDPFHTFASSVRSSLSEAQTLSRSYYDIAAAHPASSSQVITAHDRLADAIEALKADLDDVRQSVAVVRSAPERFGVDSPELARREALLTDCERELKQLESSASHARSHTNGGGQSSGAKYGSRGGDDEDDEDDPESSFMAFERDHQTQLVSEQDTVLSSIGVTLTSLQRQAATMGTEILEQTELIGTLDSEVADSQSRLGRAMGKMDEMVRRGDERLGGWCVWILIVALFFLLLIAIII
ncbi:unnamed protein product [Parajaminaea phylloscopi]